jgi:hypothetical protein
VRISKRFFLTAVVAMCAVSVTAQDAPITPLRYAWSDNEVFIVESVFDAAKPCPAGDTTCSASRSETRSSVVDRIITITGERSFAIAYVSATSKNLGVPVPSRFAALVGHEYLIDAALEPLGVQRSDAAPIAPEESAVATLDASTYLVWQYLTKQLNAADPSITKIVLPEAILLYGLGVAGDHSSMNITFRRALPSDNEWQLTLGDSTRLAQTFSSTASAKLRVTPDGTGAVLTVEHTVLTANTAKTEGARGGVTKGKMALVVERKVEKK